MAEKKALSFKTAFKDAIVPVKGKGKK